MVYVDTSGILAYLDGDDVHHKKASVAWEQVLEGEVGLMMTDFVRLESWSLIQRRLGLDAVRDFHRTLLPLMQIHKVDETSFDLLCRNVLLSKRRKLSLVDLSSFDCMQKHGIEHALAFDRHFGEMGFSTPEVKGWMGSR
jgi:predicted nucleic acid-binding protein